MTQKTEITMSEWLALIGDEIPHSLEPPPNSKTTNELSRIWKLSLRRTQNIIRDKLEDGSLLVTKVGCIRYYTIAKGKYKPKC